MIAGLHAGACLSLSGKFAPLGRQAADGLRLWADSADVELTVLDDESDPSVLARQMPPLARRVDLLFGPYSTVLMRRAIGIAAEAGRLLFNHGGSGGALNAPGRVVNVLTPARRYALPFIELLSNSDDAPLYVTAGRGAFGRDVTEGATEAARSSGLRIERLDFDSPPAGAWNLLSAGVYEDDVAAVRSARGLANPPHLICSVAAGVRQFSDDVDGADGILGIGQWAPGTAALVNAGMSESDFLAAWRDRFGDAPDYPGVQAYAAGVIAETAVDMAGTTEADALWQELARLDVQSVFGRFQLDPETGDQTGHESVLTLWRDGRRIPIPGRA